MKENVGNYSIRNISNTNEADVPAYGREDIRKSFAVRS
jgi:hypothetical protein